MLMLYNDHNLCCCSIFHSTNQSMVCACTLTPTSHRWQQLLPINTNLLIPDTFKYKSSHVSVCFIIYNYYELARGIATTIRNILHTIYSRLFNNLSKRKPVHLHNNNKHKWSLLYIYMPCLFKFHST